MGKQLHGDNAMQVNHARSLSLSGPQGPVDMKDLVSDEDKGQLKLTTVSSRGKRTQNYARVGVMTQES